MSQRSLLELEDQVAAIVKESSGYLSSQWQNPKKVSFKDGVDPVTEFDVAIENELVEKLNKLLPEAGFIVEEGETKEAEGFNWAIDPIDQTKNFVGQIPLFYSQVALLDKGTPIVAVIYNPVSNQLFSASCGNGARLNSLPLQTKWKSQLADATINIDFGGKSNLAWKAAALQRLADKTYRVRVTAGAYAPYVLTAGIDAYIVLNEETKIFDQMPRVGLAREAGLVCEEHIIDGHKISIIAPHSIAEDALKLIQGQTDKI